MLRPIVNKAWGWEVWIENNDRYCLKEMNLIKGCSCSLHWHPVKDETFLLLEGKMMVSVGDTFQLMLPGDSVRILPGKKHSFYGLEQSRFIEASSHHDDLDVRRATLSAKGHTLEGWQRLVVRNQTTTPFDDNEV